MTAGRSPHSAPLDVVRAAFEQLGWNMTPVNALEEQHEALKRDYLDMAAKWDGAREESAEHERSAARLEREKPDLIEQLEASQANERHLTNLLDWREKERNTAQTELAACRMGRGELQEQYEVAAEELAARDQEVATLTGGYHMLEEQLETAQNALRGIAHVDPPAKGTPAEELARELASVRLAARVVLDEWGLNPASGVGGDSNVRRQSDASPEEHHAEGIPSETPGSNPANSPHEHTWSLPGNSGVYRCMTCGVETTDLGAPLPASGPER